ncbi:MAG: tripartite tricarboxylate transporter substrate binding protein [Hyphomicrobiaceae bacterium]
MRKRSLPGIVVTLLLIASVAPPAWAQGNQLKIVVGFTAGGITDVFARLFAEEFRKHFGQTVIVENRAGGAGMVAASQVSRAQDDGSTLIMISGGYTIIPALQNLDFDPKTALTPINLIASAPNLLLVASDAKYRDLKSLVDDARANPAALAYGSSGVGATVHFMAMQLEREAGIKLNHIPYKSSAESVQAVIGGHIPMSFSALNSAFPLIQAGQVRAIAIATSKRSPLLPDVPTFAELGYAGVKSDTWTGIAGPAAMKSDAVARINEAVLKSLSIAEIRERINALGAEPVGQGPSEFKAVIASEIDQFEQLARGAGLPRN